MELKFDDRGLIPAVVQQRDTGEVLMVAWMSVESYRLTCETGTTWFWSRSRQELWNKGATSGNMQRVVSIDADCDASPEESYTARLLTDVEDELLKKLAEESSEVIMACKDNDHDHIRYEAGDLVYHLLVTLERYGVTLDELAGELNARMK